MSRITINDLPPAQELSPELEELIHGAGLQPIQPSIETLEAREMYAIDLAAALVSVLPQMPAGAVGTTFTQQTLANDIQVARSAGASEVAGPLLSASPDAAVDEAFWAASGPAANLADASLDARQMAMQASAGTVVNADGTVTVNTTDGYSIYRHVGGAWRQVFEGKAVAGTWREDSIAEDGTRIRDYWNGKQHGAVGSADHLSRTVVANGTLTYTFYHWNTGHYMSYGTDYYSKDSKMTWVYKLGADGQSQDLQSFELIPDAGAHYANRWTKADGWNVFKGGAPYENGLPPESGTHIRYLGDLVADKTVALPPGMTGHAETKDGKLVETFWNPDRTQSVTFVHAGKEADTPVTQTVAEAFDAAGNLVRRERTLTAADGNVVTFHGQWNEGKWLETADNYLGFKSVTVEYTQPNGPAARRYGELKDGRFAEDTFDASGNVTSRNVYSGADRATLVENYTASGNSFTIQRAFSTGNLKNDTSTYSLREGGRFELTKYTCDYKEAVTFWYNNKERKSTHYHWRTFETTDKDGYKETHYRDGYLSETSSEEECGSEPIPQYAVPMPKQDAYWNKQ